MEEDSQDTFSYVGESSSHSVASEQSAAPKKRQRKKVGIEFSSALCHQLIACVEERPNLWDLRSATYKDRALRDTLWCQIATELAVEKDAAAAKWALLRQQFRVSIFTGGTSQWSG